MKIKISRHHHGTEELAHLEMLFRQLIDGVPFTATYFASKGDPVADWFWE